MPDGRFFASFFVDLGHNNPSMISLLLSVLLLWLLLFSQELKPPQQKGGGGVFVLAAYHSAVFLPRTTTRIRSNTYFSLLNHCSRQYSLKEYSTTRRTRRRSSNCARIHQYAKEYPVDDDNNNENDSIVSSSSSLSLFLDDDSGNDDTDNDNNSNNDDTNISLQEAVLACRWYYYNNNNNQRKQRRNRSAQESRQRKRRQAEVLADEEDCMLRAAMLAVEDGNSRTGLFWHDVSELLYFKNNRYKQQQQKKKQQRGSVNDEDNNNEDDHENDNDDDDDDDDEDIAEKNEPIIWETIINSRSNVQQRNNYLNPVLEDDNDDIYWENDVSTTMSLHPEQRCYYNIDDATPSEQHIRRSQAAKRKWDNPQWKAKWYQSRWGSKAKAARKKQQQQQQQQQEEQEQDNYTTLQNSYYSNRNQTYESNNNNNNNNNQMSGSPFTTQNTNKKKKKMDPKLQLYQEFLSSPELASMTEDEIAYAIQTYTSAKQKRVASRKRTLQQRKPMQIQQIQQQKNDSNNSTVLLTFENIDPTVLEETRRKRSERAKRAYQSRLQNAKQQQPPLKSTNELQINPKRNKQQQQQQQPTTVASRFGNTPRDALDRIEQVLNENIIININNNDDNKNANVQLLPDMDDLELILQPTKLARRKQLLRRILDELFDLRGKCVPSGSDNNSKLLFVTHCSVAQLGDFVLNKVRQEHENQQQQQQQQQQQKQQQQQQQRK